MSAGQTDDLAGADALLPQMAAGVLIADKAYDADERVIRPLDRAGKSAVIPPRKHCRPDRGYDRDLYQARRLKTAGNFLAAIHLAAAAIWLN